MLVMDIGLASVADAVDRAPSFRAFLEALARGESIFPAGFGERGDVS